MYHIEILLLVSKQRVYKVKLQYDSKTIYSNKLIHVTTINNTQHRTQPHFDTTIYLYDTAQIGT